MSTIIYTFESIESSHAYKQAEQEGFIVRLPAPNELFIDIDDPEGSTWFNINLAKIDEQIGIKKCSWSGSRSGGHHQHVVVTLSRDVNSMERILLQTLLGSDRKREALSWIRLINNDPSPTLFFEKP